MTKVGWGECLQRSTHIGKLDLGMIPNLVDIEYMSMKIAEFLLPSEDFAEVQILPLMNDIRTLIVKRFDRDFRPLSKSSYDDRVVHFEEFNQLLGKNSRDKYDGSYHLMGEYIRNHPRSGIFDIERLFRRILVNLIIGNTDAHLKNFGMIYKNGTLELAPSYDIVSNSYYPEYQNIALAVGPTENLAIKDLKYKHLKLMASNFGLNTKILDFATGEIDARFDKAIIKLEKQYIVDEWIRMKFIDHLRKKWNNIKNSLGKS
jgi:serine/threonine-protein kinase HipA